MQTYKKGLLISANVFYFFLFLGFVLFTNPSKAILGKYSLANVLGLLAIIVLAIPYNALIVFLLNNSIFITTGKKKKYHIGIIYRIVIVFFLLAVTLLSVELFLRMQPRQQVLDFHPFLQSTNSKKVDDAGFHIDSDNFRYDEISKEKPKGTYRIFITGGSTVFDEWQPYEKTMVKQVENMLRKHYTDRKIEVINAGYNRYTSEHSLILYQTKLADYSPDLIVVWQGFNDMYYSCTPDYLTIGPYKSDYSHYLNVLANVVNSYFNYKFQLFSVDLLTKLFNEKFYADIKQYLPQTATQKVTYYAQEFPSIQAFSRNMDYLVRAVKSDNRAILLGNQANLYPDKGEGVYGLAQAYCNKNGKVASPDSLRKGMKLFNQESKKLAEKNQIPFVDLDKALPKTKEYMYDDVHYTEKGDKIIAETVYKAIVENKFLEPH